MGRPARAAAEEAVPLLAGAADEVPGHDLAPGAVALFALRANELLTPAVRFRSPRSALPEVEEDAPPLAPLVRLVADVDGLDEDEL